jgi:hypothetical protein
LGTSQQVARGHPQERLEQRPEAKVREWQQARVRTLNQQAAQPVPAGQQEPVAMRLPFELAFDPYLLPGHRVSVFQHESVFEARRLLVDSKALELSPSFRHPWRAQPAFQEQPQAETRFQNRSPV